MPRNSKNICKNNETKNGNAKSGEYHYDKRHYIGLLPAVPNDYSITNPSSLWAYT
jgi:hypothetical protein